MTKETLYTYLGTNGSVSTPIHLEGIQAMVKVRLRAGEGQLLTNDGGKTTMRYVIVSENDVANWKEIKDPGQD